MTSLPSFSLERRMAHLPSLSLSLYPFLSPERRLAHHQSRGRPAPPVSRQEDDPHTTNLSKVEVGPPLLCLDKRMTSPS